MDSIGILFAGGVVLICVMAFLSIYFPPRGSSDSGSITIHGTGKGVDLVDKLVNK